MRRAAHQPRQRVVTLAVVDGVAELVEHGVHPPLAGLDVAQDAHVAGAVDVDAERVLALAFAGVEVAVAEHRTDVEPETVVRTQGERLEVGIGEEVVDGDRTLGRGVLEERVVVVPRPQLAGRDREPAGQRLVDGVLPFGERFGGDAVDVVERGERARLVELAGRQGEGEVVAGAQLPGGLVAQAGQLSDAVGDLGTDLLRRLPRGASRIAVVAGAQDLGDRVVVDALPVDRAPEVVERGFDGGLELDDGAPEVSGHLVRHEGVVEQVELAADERIGVGRRVRAVRAVRTAANVSASAR